MKKTYNPYRNLLAKVRYLLHTDAKMTEAQLTDHQWMLMAKVAGSQVLVGKGGVNTMFYQFGDRKRKVCGPMELVELLKRLSRRRYVAYRVNDTLAWSEKTALAADPKPKTKIIGIRADGKEVVVYTATKTLQGYQWAKVE